MRRAAGWALLFVGVLLVLLGAAAAFLFGPDDAVATGPHALSSDGVAVITAPAVLGYAGPAVEVTVATVDGKQPVFVGIANDIDAQDYLAGASYTQIDSLSLPWDVTTTQVPGDEVPAATPRDLDWWLVRDEGLGTARISFRLPDSPVDIVAIDPDLQPGLRIEVTATLVQKGAFVGGLATAVSGLGLLTAGWVFASRARVRPVAGPYRPDAPQTEAQSEPEPGSEPVPEPQR